MGRPCMSAAIRLTETMCYIGQVKVKDQKGYPMCIAGMQADVPSAYTLCNGYIYKGKYRYTSYMLWLLNGYYMVGLADTFRIQSR